ncbi:MAG: hypothetical protein WKF89_09595 [Chitinophagaceae bacterium]
MPIILFTGSSTGFEYAAAAVLARNGHTVYARIYNVLRSPYLEQLANNNHLPLTRPSRFSLEYSACCKDQPV